MKNALKYTLKKVVKSNKNSSDMVYIYYSCNGKYDRFYTGIRADEIDLKNDELNNLIIEFDTIRLEYVKEHKTNPDPEYMKERFFNDKLLVKNDIKYITKKFLEYKNNELSNKRSLSNYENLITYLIDFSEKNNKISYDIIEDDFMLLFINYLKNKKIKKNNNFSDNAIINIIKMLIIFIKVCVDLKLIHRCNITDWSKYTKKSKGFVRYRQKFISLSVEELRFFKSLRNTFKKKSFNIILDMFLFQTLTSLRYSDLIKIDRKYITDNILVMKTQKTKTDIKIDISPLLKSILEDNNYCFNKYKNYSGYRYGLNNLLNRIDYSKCPSLLKEHTTIEYRGGGKENVITKKRYEFIKSHTGRRTFISLQYRNGISLTDIISYSGHSQNSKVINGYIVDNNVELKLSEYIDNMTN